MSLIDNFEEASKQIGAEYNSLKVVDHTEHIVLPASYLGKIKHAVGLLLNGKLHNYSSTLHALPIAYNNKKVKLLSRVGTIIGTQPCVHFDVQTEFVIFKPSLNDVLQCTVHKKQHGRIGCLVHGYFYASVSCSENDSPDVGDVILFKVTKLEDDGYGFLSIIGEYQSTIQHAEIPEEQEESSKENAELDSGIDDDHTLNKPTSMIPKDEREVISSSPLLFPESEPSLPEMDEEEEKIVQDTDATPNVHERKVKKKSKKEKKETKQKHKKKKKEKTKESVSDNNDKSFSLNHSISVASVAPEIAQSDLKESKSECIPVRVSEVSSALQSWLRNEAPPEESKTQEPDGLGSEVFNFSQSVDDLLTFEKKPSKKSEKDKKRKRKKIPDLSSTKTTESPCEIVPDSVLPDTNVRTDANLVVETAESASPVPLKIKKSKKKSKKNYCDQDEEKEKKSSVSTSVAKIPGSSPIHPDNGFNRSTPSIVDEVKSVFLSVDAQIPLQIAKQMKKLEKMLKREEKIKRREEKAKRREGKAKRREEKAKRREEKIKKREVKQLKREKRLKKQQRKEEKQRTKSLKIKRVKYKDEKQAEMKLSPAGNANTPDFASLVASLMEKDAKKTGAKSKKRKLNDSENVFLSENPSPKKAKRDKHKKKKQ